MHSSAPGVIKGHRGTPPAWTPRHGRSNISRSATMMA
jgi:hypothetical protein